MPDDVWIGDWRVEPALSRLSNGEITERLNPKATEVLAALAERPGEVWTKEELLDRVWPDQFIGDDVLANAVYELRRALGDDARSPRYIETVHRRGYRLIAQVRREPGVEPEAPRSSAPSPDIALTTAIPTAGADPPRTRLLAALAAVALVVVALVAWRAWDGGETLSVAVRSVEVVGAVDAASNLGPRLESVLRQEIFASPHLERPRLFRNADVAIDAAAQVADGEVVLTAQLDSSRVPGQSPEALREPYPPDPTMLDRFAETVRLELELRALGDEELRTAVGRSGAHTLAAHQAFERAERLIDEQAFEQAVTSLNEATHLDPRFVAAYERLARMQDNRGYSKHLALEQIDTAIRIAEEEPSTSPEELLWLALRRARIEGDVAEQLRIVDEILARTPGDVRARFNRAWIHATLLKDCEMALDLYPVIPGIDESPVYRRFWAEARFVCEDDPIPALDMLDELAADSPTEPDLDNLAYFQILTGRLAEAEETLRRRDTLAGMDQPFIALEPLDGLWLMAQERYEEAVDAIDRYEGPSLGPHFKATAAVRQGQALLALGRVEEARTLQTDALEVKPDSIPNLWIAGLAHLAQGDVAAARERSAEIRALHEATGSHHELEFLYHLDGRIALAEGRPREAAEIFRQGLDRERPRDRALFLHALGEAWRAAGEQARAEAAFREALAFNPRHRPSRCALQAMGVVEGEGIDACRPAIDGP
jgi:DNA-binding winged helix-turn-helix (wHTH) protein/tetratricopeptide (TPR) repeat protein